MAFPAHPNTQASMQARTLLLAGSDAATLTEWTARLRECGHEPLTARDRSALLYGLQHDDHALLIVLLGAESELEWLQAARQLVTEHGLPLLAVCDSTLRERAILAGASECLPPDISTAELTMRLRGNLRSAQAIQDLERERRDHARTQRQAATGCFRFDPLSEALQFSDEGLRLLGLDAAHAPASLAQFALRLPGENRDSVRNWMHACAGGTHPAPLELLWRGTNGSGQALRLCCGGLEPRGGREIVYGFLENKPEQRRAREQRRNHDAADRERFLERLALLLSRSKAGEEHVAVLSLHISFERLGALSAEALEHVRERTEARLAEQTRDRDLFGDCLADSQAENVAILLPELSRPHDAYKVARRLQEDLHKPIVHAGHSHLVEVTIGIALAGADAANPAALLHEAREAEHEARDEQGGSIRFRSAALNSAVFERLTIESSLKRAIEHRELCVYYQPKVDLRTGRLSGFEALARWKHPSMGMISPGQFIPIAEDTGLILPLGELVLEEACQQGEAWRREGLMPVRMAVNLSGLHFRSPDLVGKVEYVLRATGFPAELLEIELTESTLLQHGDSTMARLRQLKSMGVRLSIDDFGTGYSSLAYLKRFPVDSLKIDQSFVRDLTQDPEDSAITTSILLMGKSLNLKVVAEGLETQAQLDFLKALDCDEGQGYFFGRPRPAEEARALVEKQILFGAA